MVEQEFMKQILEADMPDFERVERLCLEKLKEENVKRNGVMRNVAAFGIICGLCLFCCLAIPSVQTMAGSLFEKIQIFLQINGEKIEIGDSREMVLKIPKDCEKGSYKGVSYLSKSYRTLSALEKDIGKKVSAWRKTERYSDVLFNVFEDEYARISLIYDITHGKIRDLDKKTTDNLKEPEALSVFISIPLTEKVTLKDLILKNEVLNYSTVDDAGNIVSYKQNIEYQMIKQYHSRNLDTDVTVIRRCDETEALDENIKDIKESADYCMFFVYDGMCYQVNVSGTLPVAEQILEEFQE